MCKILTKDMLKEDGDKLSKLMDCYYSRVKDGMDSGKFIDAMTDNMHIFLEDDAYAICEKTINPLTQKTYFIVWNIYAPNNGLKMFNTICENSKKLGVDIVSFWSNDPEKFQKLTSLNKTGLKMTLAMFEKEV